VRDDGTNRVEIPATTDRTVRSIGFDLTGIGVRYLAERVHSFDSVRLGLESNIFTKQNDRNNNNGFIGTGVRAQNAMYRAEHPKLPPARNENHSEMETRK
jgi:hypothetical protein